MTPFSKEFGQVDRLRGLQVSWRNIPITLIDSQMLGWTAKKLESNLSPIAAENRAKPWYKTQEPS